MNGDDEDIDEDEDDEEVENLNTTAIKCFTLMNGIGIHTFLIILEQVNDQFDPQLLPKKSFDILIETLVLASYWLVFLAKKRLGYPGREVILSHANLLALTNIGEIARFLSESKRDVFNCISN
jgi:hypothetical protein